MNKMTNEGLVPLYLRVIKNRKARFISLGIKIYPQQWDKSNMRVKNRHPNSTRLNSYLAHKLVEANDIMLDNETKNKYVSSAKLKAMILGKEEVSFNEYSLEFFERYKSLKQIATYRKCMSALKKLNQFTKNKNLLFSEIDVSFLKNYEVYMKTKLRNSHNTVIADMKIIKRVFNAAINESKVERDIYPFNRFPLKSKKTMKDHLSEDDIYKIIALPLSEGSRACDVRNIFIFACYAAGIRISDLLTLKWSNIKGEYVHLKMRKTGELIRFKLVKTAQAVLSLYDRDTNKPTDYIFPFLKNGDESTPEKVFNAISRNTALVNKYLKIVAEQAQIEHKNLSSHYARRSFTCLALKKGMSLEHTSKLLGHGGSRVTLQSYAKFAQPDLDDSMSLLNS